MQRMAMQCWCLHFQSQDHSFLLQSNMFSNISKALSGTEEGEINSGGNSDKKTKGDKVEWVGYAVEPLSKNTWTRNLPISLSPQSIDVVLMENVVSRGTLKVSSNEAMISRFILFTHIYTVYDFNTK